MERTWEYRVCRVDEESLEVREIYTDGTGKMDGHSSASLVGFDLDELKSELTNIKKAFSKPVIDLTKK